MYMHICIHVIYIHVYMYTHMHRRARHASISVGKPISRACEIIHAVAQLRTFMKTCISAGMHQHMHLAIRN
jgi:hypothetical protein